jgi:DNA-binding transcriptional LysR family regulator
VLPKILAILSRERPDVRVTLFVGNTDQVARGVLDMRFMLGFIEGPLHLKDLDDITFEEDELVPVAAPDHPILRHRSPGMEDIRRQRLLMREPGSGTRELIATTLHLQDVLEQGDVMEFGNTEALKQAALHSGGIAWLPRISVQSELHEGALHELGTKSLRIRRPLKVLRRSRSQASPIERMFLEHLKPGLSAQL